MRYLITTILLFLVLSATYAKDKTIGEIKLLFLEENFDKVLETIQENLLRDSLNAELWFYQGLAHRSQNHHVKAEKSFRKAARLEMNNAEYMYHLGRTHMDLNQNMLAKNAFERVMQLDSMHFKAGNKLAQLYLGYRYYGQALETYLRFNEYDSLNYIYDKKIAAIYSSMLLHEHALYCYQSAYRKEKDDIDLIVNLSDKYYAVAKESEDSLATLYIELADKVVSEALERYPNSRKLLFAKGSFLLNEKWYEQAVECFRQIPNHQRDPETIRHLGIACFKTQQFDSTIVHLEKYIQLNLNDFNSYYYLGLACRSKGQLDKSYEYLQTAISILTPDWSLYSNFYVELAETRLGQKKFEEAILELDKAYYYNSKLTSVIYQKAYIYDIMLKDYKKAIALYKEFVNLCEDRKVNRSSSLYSFVGASVKRIRTLEKELFFQEDIFPETAWEKKQKENEARYKKLKTQFAKQGKDTTKFIIVN